MCNVLLKSPRKKRHTDIHRQCHIIYDDDAWSQGLIGTGIDFRLMRVDLIQRISLLWRQGPSIHRPLGCLLTQVQASSKENFKAPHYWLFVWVIPAQRASNSLSATMSWRCHGQLRPHCACPDHLKYTRWIIDNAKGKSSILYIMYNVCCRRKCH